MRISATHSSCVPLRRFGISKSILAPGFTTTSLVRTTHGRLPSEFPDGSRVLLLLASFGKEAKPEPGVAKLSQETEAEIVGTKRSRVSFFMNKFRKMGFIEYNVGLKVHSSLLNVVLHD